MFDFSLLDKIKVADVPSAASVTKPDVIASMPSSPGAMSFMPFFQMLIALGIVLALVKTIVPRLASKLNKKLTSSAGSSIAIEESANFAGGNLYVVSARGKSLLLSVSSQGVSCLADLTESKTEEKPVFQEILATETAVIEVEAEEVEDSQPMEVRRDARAMLDRLERFVS